jgi:hypothetical protein
LSLCRHFYRNDNGLFRGGRLRLRRGGNLRGPNHSRRRFRYQRFDHMCNYRRRASLNNDRRWWSFDGRRSRSCRTLLGGLCWLFGLHLTDETFALGLSANAIRLCLFHARGMALDPNAQGQG